MSDAETIEDKYRALAERLDEATLRLWAAVEARTLGRGGVSTVAKATGMSRTTICSGLKDLESLPLAAAPPAAVGVASKRRIRAEGGGRKKLTAKDTTLLRDLDALVEPTARGDPQSPLRWTCKSTPRLAKELAEQGHQVSQRSVCDLLAHLGYSLQSTRKTREGGQHADRDAQFNHIARRAAQYQAAGDPVISVGGVDDWRGGTRSRGVAVGRPLSRCAGASFQTLAPFPVAARQTGRADRPHPAFTCVIKPSRSAGRRAVAAGRKGRVPHTGTRPDIGGTRCLSGRCGASTNVSDAARYTS